MRRIFKVPFPELRSLLASIVACCLSALATTPVTAEQPTADEPPAVPWRETWAGAEATKNSWAVYTGVAIAPFGAVQSDGWRIRAVGGYGEYSYKGHKISGAFRGETFVPDNNPPKSQTFRGTSSFADVLVGYQAQIGRLTLKGFVGAAGEGQMIDPAPGSYAFEPGSSVAYYLAGGDTSDLEWGPKAALETWLEVSPLGWASLDLAATQAYETYSGRLRLGYRALPQLSLGFEAAALGNAEYDGQRGGLFARYEWTTGEVAIAWGRAGDRSDMSGAYGSVNLLYRY